MDIKQKETNILNNALRCKDYIGKDTQSILSVLKINKSIIKPFEGPDFIIANGDNVIGIEHFLVDTLRDSSNVKVSVSRDVEKNIPELVEKYEHGNSFIKDNSNYKKAMEDVLIETTKVYNTSENFSHSDFIKEFHRIAVETHKGKVSRYRSRIKKNFGVLDSSKIKMYFLIEIKYKLQTRWVVTRNGKENKLALKGIPFTKDFVKELKKLSNVDYIILYFSDVLHQKDCIYAFDTTDIEKKIREIDKRPIFDTFKTEKNGTEIQSFSVKDNDGLLEVSIKGHKRI